MDRSEDGRQICYQTVYRLSPSKDTGRAGFDFTLIRPDPSSILESAPEKLRAWLPDFRPVCLQFKEHVYVPQSLEAHPMEEGDGLDISGDWLDTEVTNPQLPGFFHHVIDQGLANP